MDPRTARIVTLVAGLVVAASAFLPWATAGLIGVTGTQRADGVIAIGLGLGIAVLVAVTWERGPSQGLRWTMGGLGALAIGLFGLVWWTVENRTDAGVGTGVYLGLGAAFVAVVASSYTEGRVKLRAAKDPDALVHLEELLRLKDSGVLTDEEYAAKKRDLLDRV